jgi:hypothetical protein
MTPSLVNDVHALAAGKGVRKIARDLKVGGGAVLRLKAA